MRAKSNRSERSEQRSAVRTKTYKLQVSDWLLPVDVFLQREIKILQVKERIWSDHVNHQYLCENFQKPPVFKRKVSQRPWDLIANRGSQTSETLFAPVNRLLNGYTDSGPWLSLIARCMWMRSKVGTMAAHQILLSRYSGRFKCGQSWSDAHFILTRKFKMAGSFNCTLFIQHAYLCKPQD